jgi:magnesium-transporting ATPase (P-type)
MGEVVGVTGDGTNDAPALKCADVGLSMGLSGTEVAKEASDIVIMDDRFLSIVQAVMWGRSVYDNIRKFLQFQLTVNIVALSITFIAAVMGFDPPLNAVMMLWVNLIMDTMGALALGTEAPTEALLRRRPFKRNASLISRRMWRNILVQSAYQLILLLVLLFYGNEWFGVPMGNATIEGTDDIDYRHFSILFNAFVFCQVFNEFNARKIQNELNVFAGIFTNWMFLMIIVLTVGLQFFIIEKGGTFTKTTSLTQDQWVVTMLLGSFSIPLGLFMRTIPVREDPKQLAGYKLPWKREGGEPARKGSDASVVSDL